MYIILGFTILVFYIFYRFYFTPKLEISRYKALFKKLGYRVYEMPFTFLGISQLQEWEKGRNLHKDVQYNERTIYPDIDISIGNAFDKVIIHFVKPELIKEFLSINTISKYPKDERLAKGIMLTMGKGITFSEGEAWKNKRKIMSNVFNFDFVKEKTSKICEICDRCYDNYEKSHQIAENKFQYDPVEVSSKIFNGAIMKCFFGSDLVD